MIKCSEIRFLQTLPKFEKSATQTIIVNNFVDHNKCCKMNMYLQNRCRYSRNRAKCCRSLLQFGQHVDKHRQTSRNGDGAHRRFAPGSPSSEGSRFATAAMAAERLSNSNGRKAFGSSQQNENSFPSRSILFYKYPLPSSCLFLSFRMVFLFLQE